MTPFARCAKSARKAKGHGHLRRAEILEAAERIFVREGYAGATIRKIADEVGVSSTALYMHFRDKGEMLLAICQGAFAELTSRNEEILGAPLAPVERVRRMLDAYLDFALANPNAYQLVFDGALNEVAAAHEEGAAKLGKECYGVFEGAVAELAASNCLERPADVTAQAMWAAAHGLASLLITKTGFPWADPAAVRAAMLDGLFKGLLRA